MNVAPFTMLIHQVITILTAYIHDIEQYGEGGKVSKDAYEQGNKFMRLYDRALIRRPTMAKQVICSRFL